MARAVSLLLALGLLACTLAVVPAASATLRICGLPVDADCYDMEHREWCTLYARTPTYAGCVENLVRT